MNAVSIWERTDIGDRLDAVMAEAAEHGNYSVILAQIPGLFGDSEKASYLGFRALGFRPTEVINILGLDSDQIEVWYDTCPGFREFERDHLWDLQRYVNGDIVRLQFMRNMVMFLMKDSMIIRQGMMNLDSLTLREYNYFRTIRRFYDTGQLLNLDKAIAPERHRNQALTLNFGPNQVTVIGNEDGSVEVIDAD